MFLQICSLGHGLGDRPWTIINDSPWPYHGLIIGVLSDGEIPRDCVCIDEFVRPQYKPNKENQEF